jgi:hypothetical protein
MMENVTFVEVQDTRKLTVLKGKIKLIKYNQTKE